MSETLGTWLTSLGACSPAIPVFAPFTNVGAAYASITQPDWLLWFCFAQTTDLVEKARVVRLLQGVMAPTITAAATGTIATQVATAFTDVVSWLEGTLDPNAAKADLKALMSAVQALPDDTGGVKVAAHCAAVFISLCLAAPGVPSATVGGHLALKWMKLLQVQGTLPSDDTAPGLCTTALRNAIPLDNKSPIPT